MALLEVKNLTKNFGGLTAVGDVSMELNEGELVGLIGPNGAGKTTLFNLLTGVYEPSEGSVSLDGILLNSKKPYKIASLGSLPPWPRVDPPIVIGKISFIGMRSIRDVQISGCGHT